MSNSSFYDEALDVGKAPQNLCPSDTNKYIFGNYISSDWVNSSKIFADDSFLLLAPTSMLTYYNSIIRPNIQWYRGYVPGIHSEGFFSTKIATRICKLSAGLTMNGGYRVETETEAKRFIDLFNKKKGIIAKLKQKLPLHNGIGFTLAKVDIDAKGKFDFSFIQGNRYFAQVDESKNVLGFRAVIKFVSANVTDNSNDTESEGYYLIEDRFFYNDIPVQYFYVIKGPTIITSPIFAKESDRQGIPYDKLNSKIRKVVDQKIGANNLEKYLRLPFKDLGAKVILNEESATGVEEYSCFSDSTIADVHTQLYEYDYTFTKKMEDKYMAQTMCIYPDSMSPPMVENDRLKAAYIENTTDLDHKFIRRIRTLSPEKQIPLFIQAQMRSIEHDEDMKEILSGIASQIGFSAITLASHLTSNDPRTATEINAEENATRATIQKKRDLLVEGLNYLYRTLLKAAGFGQPDCDVVFNDGSLTNPTAESKDLIAQVEGGIMSRKTAIKRKNPQYSQEEVDEELERIQNEQKIEHEYDSDNRKISEFSV